MCFNEAGGFLPRKLACGDVFVASATVMLQ